ncbi:Hypothetical protein, putative [Bodo saltans]|uniref:Uncharacterized protein n=1 Tax=Bodo saltans TaxID=75058 RepID=A0A0S4J8I2_BODSA|nr:Hypothetical protein, putative [Bodo saltans]|eukprot:CUG87742.1 Hypothetical protein, putative [Bodo saltans]
MAAMASITSMYAQGWSLLCCGCTMKDVNVVASISDRPVVIELLCTVTKRTREDFAQMRAIVENSPIAGAAFARRRRRQYEMVKNIPGYFGMWTESILRFRKEKEGGNNGGKGGDEWQMDSLIPLNEWESLKSTQLRDVSKEVHRDFTSYWRAVVNRQGDGRLDVVPDGDVLDRLDQCGLLLPWERSGHDDGRFYLSPLAFSEGFEGAREHTLISRALEKLQHDEAWTGRDKVNAIKALVEVALVLTASYVNDTAATTIMAAKELPLLSVGTLINRLCGECCVIVHADAADDGAMGLPAVFPDYGSELAHVSVVSAFPSKAPCATKALKESTQETQCSDKETRRFQDNAAVLNSVDVSVLRQGCLCHKGYFAASAHAMVFRAGKGGQKVLLLFAMADDCSTSDTRKGFVYQAMSSLDGVLPYVKLCDIRRVCVAFCNPAVRIRPTRDCASSSSKMPKNQVSSAPLRAF